MVSIIGKLYLQLSIEFYSFIHWPNSNGVQPWLLVRPTEFVFGSPYTATKKALNAFMRDASMQMQPKGISITTCLPGSTKTALFDKDLTDKDVQVGSFARMNPGKSSGAVKTDRVAIW